MNEINLTTHDMKIIVCRFKKKWRKYWIYKYICHHKWIVWQKIPSKIAKFLEYNKWKKLAVGKQNELYGISNWHLTDKMTHWHDDILTATISPLIWGHIDNFCGFVNIHITLIFFMGYVQFRSSNFNFHWSAVSTTIFNW